MKNLIQLLQDIDKHNTNIYNNTPINEKIDFSLMKKSWGTEVIPKEFWIDIKKEYETIDGHKVKLHGMVLKNASGLEVTFPVKGVILDKEGNSRRNVQAIWTLDGRIDVIDSNFINPKNLILKAS